MPATKPKKRKETQKPVESHENGAVHNLGRESVSSASSLRKESTKAALAQMDDKAANELNDMLLRMRVKTLEYCLNHPVYIQATAEIGSDAYNGFLEDVVRHTVEKLGKSEEDARGWHVPAAEELYYIIKCWNLKKKAERNSRTEAKRLKARQKASRNRKDKCSSEDTSDSSSSSSSSDSDTSESESDTSATKYSKQTKDSCEAKLDKEDVTVKPSITTAERKTSEIRQDTARVEPKQQMRSSGIVSEVDDGNMVAEASDGKISRPQLEPQSSHRKTKPFLYRSGGTNPEVARLRSSNGSKRFQKSRSVESTDKIISSPPTTPKISVNVAFQGTGRSNVNKNFSPKQIEEKKTLGVSPRHLKTIREGTSPRQNEINARRRRASTQKTSPSHKGADPFQDQSNEDEDQDLLSKEYLNLELAPDNDKSGDFLPPKKRLKKEVQVVILKSPRKPRQPLRRTDQQSHHFTSVPNSCIPIPPLYASSYGLIQEKHAHVPFQMLICVICLNKTINDRAIAAAEKIVALYKTPSDLANASERVLTNILQPTGFQNKRAKNLIRFAKSWIQQPPRPDTYFKFKRSKKAINEDPEFLSGEFLEIERPKPYIDSWEISHLHGCGVYAIDSWRIFCRDKFRTKAYDHLGSGWEMFHSAEEVNRIKAEGGFVPEWKLVHPSDKELRAYLVWLWKREGIEWNPETGEKNFLSQDKISEGLEAGKINTPVKERRQSLLSSPTPTYSTITEDEIGFDDKRLKRTHEKAFSREESPKSSRMKQEEEEEELASSQCLVS